MVSMGETTSAEQKALFRFSIPDHSVSAYDRSLFAPPANKEVREEKLSLHDFRTSEDITHGGTGIDTQGFTYIKRRSALSDSGRWFQEDDLERIYFPEVEKLLCELTGAKRAVVNNVAFRRKVASKEDVDHSFVMKRGCDFDLAIAKSPKDVAVVYGKVEDQSLEPSHLAHIDYSLQGLRDSVRYCRKDICAAAVEALKAEDEGVENVPRYAAFSVWRPVKPVKRDPLAVCDWRTLDKSEFQGTVYRALSDVTPDGEYMLEANAVLPSKKPEQQRWYWMPEQKEDDVLIIKLADTAAEKDPSIAGGCPHLSPIIPSTEDEEARCSVECRVFAFW
ncbi:hypothetical protein LTR22_025515 [Elasticomyces elasticus]|nr:hypothetical protein LTR22_025515 [Elasticomyces elasticus]